MLALAVIPILDTVAGYEDALFGYQTSVRWDTFFASLGVDVFRSVGLKVGILFLAVAVIDAAYPWIFGAFSREGRSRFGRSAVVAAVTVLGVIAALRTIMQLAADRFPSTASVSIDIANTVVVTFPAVLAIADAIFNTIVGSAVIASFAVALGLMRKRPWLSEGLIIAIIFCAALDPSATAARTPLMLARAAVLAIAAWATIRYLLRDNLLAWPVTIFIAAMLNGIVGMAGNDRPDLWPTPWSSGWCSSRPSSGWSYRGQRRARPESFGVGQALQPALLLRRSRQPPPPRFRRLRGCAEIEK